MPFSYSEVISDLNYGLLYIYAFSSLAVYGIILADNKPSISIFEKFGANLYDDTDKLKKVYWKKFIVNSV
jgi:hypothetical protein